MNTEYKKMLIEAIETDGLQFCLDALQEECAELIQAISHLRRGRVSIMSVIEEMADVQIMLDLIIVGFGDDRSIIDKKILDKACRIGKRIKFKNERKRISKCVATVTCSTVGDSRYDKEANCVGPCLQNNDHSDKID